MARAFAEFQAADCGKLTYIIGMRKLGIGHCRPLRHDAAREQSRMTKPRKNKRLVKQENRAMKARLLLTE